MARTRSRAQRTGAAQRADATREAASAFPFEAWIPCVLHMLFLAGVVLAFTPFTLNLDDIKVRLFLTFGTILLPVALAAVAYGVAPAPHRLVTAGLIAFGIVMGLSCLASEFPWGGIHRLFFFLASAGFFMGGLAIGSTRRTSNVYLIFLVSLVALVTLFGFSQYDIFGTHSTVMSRVWDVLSRDLPDQSALRWYHHLSFTFATRTQDDLMSTILNRDFYAAFLLLYFPFGLALALAAPAIVDTEIPGRRIRARAASPLLTALGYTTTLFCLVSVFLCKSKGEYIFSAGSIGLFALLYATAIHKTEVMRRSLLPWVGGMAIFLATLLFLNWPGLVSQLKTLGDSFGSRGVIFSGAWDIFRESPLLGSGPGTFRIKFPEFRSPDYFTFEISNVTIFAHNLFLDILSETGLLGLASYGLFAGAIGWLAFRTLYRVRDMRLRLMMIAALCGLFGMYGSNMTSPNASWPIGAVGLWSMLGFTLGLVRQAEGWSPATPAMLRRRSGAPGPRPGALRTVWARGFVAALAVAALAGLYGGFVEAKSYWKSAVAYNEGKQPFDEIMRAHNDILTPGIADFFDVNRDLRKIVQRFDEAIELYPRNMSAYYQLGSVYNNLSNMNPSESAFFLRRADEIYGRLERYWPLYSELPFNLGVIHYQLAEAKTPERQRLAPGDRAGREQLAEEIKQHDLTSLDYFLRMRKLSNKERVLLNVGDSYADAVQYDAGYLESARSALREGVKKFPRWSQSSAPDALPGAFARHLLRLATRNGDRRLEIEARLAIYAVQPRTEAENLIVPIELAWADGFDDLFERGLDLGFERNPVDPRLHGWRARAAKKAGDVEATLRAATNHAKLGGIEGDVLEAGVEAARETADEEAARAFFQAASAENIPPAVKSAAEAWLRDHPPPG